jgi:hypothetical protein
MDTVMKQDGRGGTSFIDLAAFERAKLATDPFPYVLVPGFLPAASRNAISADYPKIDRPGSFPAGDLDYGPGFARLLAEIQGDAMRDAFARKFSVDLTGKPTMVTVRGQARMGDGQIHTDTSSKIITVLIYMNEEWEAPGGRLRLLRSNNNLNDMVAEVPPAAGTLLAFLVTPHSWHGHYPASGPRRVIQLNWVESQGVVWRERIRHGISARIKKLFPARA